MRLEWSRLAIIDRTIIFDYIVADNPLAAVAVDDRISERIGGLVQFPKNGRLGRVDGTRELVITGTPYIASYEIDGDIVRILRVLHGSQRWPDVLDDR